MKINKIYINNQLLKYFEMAITENVWKWQKSWKYTWYVTQNNENVQKYVDIENLHILKW